MLTVIFSGNAILDKCQSNTGLNVNTYDVKTWCAVHRFLCKRLITYNVDNINLLVIICHISGKPHTPKQNDLLRSYYLICYQPNHH